MASPAGTILAIILPVIVFAGGLVAGAVYAQRAADAAIHKAGSDAAQTIAGITSDQQRDIVAEAVTEARRPAPDPNFPIDAVFTWVDGNDAAWRASKAAEFERVFGQRYVPTARDPEAPPDGKDELYYSVRCLAKFCPWLRTVWIVTARPHVPRWWVAGMTLGSVQVVVVHHDRLFDTACTGTRPTFNSNVIEGQLPHLHRLAEHFLMFNDDMFVGQPMRRADFFTDAGLPRVHLRDVSTVVAAMQTMWGQFLRTVMAKCQALGLGNGLIPEHIAAPMRKSVYAAVVRALRQDVCAQKQFRTAVDFPVWYVALNAAPRAARPSHVTTKYFGTGPAFEEHMRLAAAPHLFCINQELTEGTRDSLARILGENA